jgi:hypothetical protein
MKRLIPLCAALLLGIVPAAIVQTVTLSAQGVGGNVGVPIYVQTGQPGAPSATITGSVVDENGTPVANALVLASYEITMPDGLRRPVGGGSRSTDPSGQFTLERLRPGSYIVATVPLEMRVPNAVDQMTFGVTYFPGVSDLAKAEHVTATEGGGQPITIRVHRTRGFHVRGIVTSDNHRSAAGLTVQVLQTLFTSTFTLASAPVKADGTFDVAPVVPGVYSLMVRVGFGDANSAFGSTDVTISDHDLTGVRLNMTSGGVIHGRLVFKDLPKGPAPLGVSVHVGGAPPTAFGSPPPIPIVGRIPGPVPVSADWTFEIRGLNGRYRFILEAPGLPEYAVVRTVLDKEDIGNSLDVSITGGTHELLFYLNHR